MRNIGRLEKLEICGQVASSVNGEDVGGLIISDGRGWLQRDRRTRMYTHARYSFENYNVSVRANANASCGTRYGRTAQGCTQYASYFEDIF